MSVVKVQGNASGTGIFTIAAPATNTDRTLTLPDQTGTVLTNAGPFTASSSASAGAVTIDSSNNVGIGTSSPGTKLDVNGQRIRINNASDPGLELSALSAVKGYVFYDTTNNLVTVRHASSTGINCDSSGNLLVGTTSVAANAKVTVSFAGGSGSSRGLVMVSGSTASTAMVAFQNPNGYAQGEILTSGTSTSYTTSSDYRLKEDVQPMVGALSKVAALKPVTYKWKIDGSDGQGFIAHELQEVVPDAVVGEKDAVNEDGSIKPQGIDTSFLVATLTAAIQEQQATIESLTARIVALEAK